MDGSADVRIEWQRSDLVSDVPWVEQCYVHMNGLWRIDLSNFALLELQPELAKWHAQHPDNQYALLPEPLRMAVLQRLFLPTLDEISRALGAPVVFVGPPNAGSEITFADAAFFRVTVDGSETTIVRLAWQDTVTLVSVLDAVKELGVRAQARVCDGQCTFKASLVLGRMQLTLPEVRALEIGDVLLPLEIFPFEPTLVFPGGVAFACTLQGNTLCITNLVVKHAGNADSVRRESGMSDTVAQSSEPLLSKEAMQTLEFDIRFELPGFSLSLEQVGRITVGQTFTLEHDAATLPVRVYLGGRPVAEGRLVDVSGKAGVQLTAVFAQPEDPA